MAAGVEAKWLSRELHVGDLEICSDLQELRDYLLLQAFCRWNDRWKNWKCQFLTFSLSQVKFNRIVTQTKCCWGSRTREMQIARASLFIAHPSLGNHFVFSLNTGTFWSQALWRVFTKCPKKALFKKIKFLTVLGDHGPFWIVTKVRSKMIVMVQNCPWSSKQSKTWNFWKVLFQPLVNLEDCE